MYNVLISFANGRVAVANVVFVKYVGEGYFWSYRAKRAILISWFYYQFHASIVMISDSDRTHMQIQWYIQILVITQYKKVIQSIYGKVLYFFLSDSLLGFDSVLWGLQYDIQTRSLVYA